jgi:rhamnogalacturonyl hydrolase YesR
MPDKIIFMRLSLTKKSYLLLLLTSIFLVPVTAQKLPLKSKVLKSMELANAYFMQKWPDVGKEIVTTKARPSNIWTRAVYYEGLMELYKIDPRKEYLDYAVRWGEFHKWGLRDGIKTRNADNQCCGQTYIMLYQMDKKPERIRDIKASIDSMLRSPKISDWTWIDAIQMALPVFAQLGVIYEDNRYFERMYLMYMHSREKEGGCGLYNKQDSLWWRDKDFVPPYKEPNGQDCYWSRGNGWMVAALVRTMSIVPKNTPHYKEYLNDYMQMMGALPRLQRKDGFWNVSLHDSTNFGGKELTGSALFIYGMAWGVNNGYLDSKIYKPIIAKTWNAMVNECLHSNGFLGWVQGTGKEPKDGQPLSYDKVPDFEDYGLGCFLLAGSEVYKLK